MKKKFLLTIISLLALCFCFTAKLQPASAAVELSNGMLKNGDTHGADKQKFTFTMPETGYFYYQVYLEAGWYLLDSKMHWSESYYIYTDMECEGKSKLTKERVSYSKSGYESFTSPTYKLKKGQKVTISVFDADKNIKTPFSLRAFYTEEPNKEKEDNGTKKKANVIKNHIVYNASTKKKDVDWYVFTAPVYSTYIVALHNANTSSKTKNLPITVYVDGKDPVTKKVANGYNWEDVLRVTLQEGEKLYIKIKGSYTGDYQVRVKRP